MRKINSILFLLFIFVCFTLAQTKVTVVEDSIYSPALKAYSKFNVVLPANYYMSDERFITIYLLHGYTGDYNDWISRTNLVKYARDYNFIIVTPDGKNSWYVNSPNKKNSNYENYIIKELIPYIGKKYRAMDTRHGRVIAGLSMGGYGALRLALKYPGTFYYSAAFSGAFYAPTVINEAKKNPDKFMQEYIDIYGTEPGEFWNDGDVHQLIEKSDITKLPYLYITCGKDDNPHLFDSNRQTANLLQKKKALYEYHELPGAHNWMYWDKAINEVMYKLSIFDNLKQ